MPESLTAAIEALLFAAEEPLTVGARACAAGLLLLLSVMDITHTSFVPYIYLRF